MARRSLVLKKSLNKGSEISLDDLIPKRPGTGISPSEINLVLGKKLKRNKKADSVLFFDDII